MFTKEDASKRVFSKHFGEGTIENVWGDHGDLAVTVKFDNSEVRQSFALNGYYCSKAKFARFDMRNIELV